MLPSNYRELSTHSRLDVSEPAEAFVVLVDNKEDYIYGLRHLKPDAFASLYRRNERAVKPTTNASHSPLTSDLCCDIGGSTNIRVTISTFRSNNLVTSAAAIWKMTEIILKAFCLCQSRTTSLGQTTMLKRLHRYVRSGECGGGERTTQ